jgi:SsrA-binding protein
MPRKDHPNFSPRIVNRRAFHEYEITAKLECGIALTGSEVKSLRQGHANLQEAFARVEKGNLVLHGMHIDPYEKATLAWNHDPNRERRLLAHRREIRKLESELKTTSATLIPLTVYFKGGLVKVEIGVGRGKKLHDKRETIKRKEQDRELRRLMSRRG